MVVGPGLRRLTLGVWGTSGLIRIKLLSVMVRFPLPDDCLPMEIQTDRQGLPIRPDCLHPVPPTMANVWNHLIWHDAVVLRKERADKAQADAKAVKEMKQAKLIAEEEARLAADKEAKKKKAEEEEAKKVGVEGLPSEVIKPE